MNEQCANAECRRSIDIIPGHRHRRYCSDRCKQVAYRRRHGQKARPTQLEREADRVVRRLQMLEARWPGLSFRTYYVLQKVLAKHGEQLTAEIAETIMWEIHQAQRHQS